MKIFIDKVAQNCDETHVMVEAFRNNQSECCLNDNIWHSIKNHKKLTSIKKNMYLVHCYKTQFEFLHKSNFNKYSEK
eukprot:UN11734